MRKERDVRFDEATGAWFGKSMPVDRAEMESRVWRFGELTPSPRAFLDCTLPGHVRTLFSALGRGADDEQLEGTAVEQAENYHIDFVKAAPQNGAALHSHGSEETFIALTGRWQVFWGDAGADMAILEPYDGIVVPGGVLRGFRNIADTEAVLLVVLGAHNTGHCIWAEDLQPVFAAAKE
ncbi:cupin domain-containing protein [Pelagibius litoralis]|uniref:Cupin domain-containing protein n=1 Tax=Pelagibius litoralis TaxID=374515 RepID=A0A967K9M3_9PROT|nr:cupin domain-containing protein [Pelagibius litoralis]NIA69972.1 cupin domain-containing protein [Pelagibius litoralis]